MTEQYVVLIVIIIILLSITALVGVISILVKTGFISNMIEDAEKQKQEQVEEERTREIKSEINKLYNHTPVQEERTRQGYK